MSDKNLLEVKKQIRAKKPVFVRQDAHKKKRVGVKWRAPKGIQSKMRLNKKGYAPKLKQGYSTPQLLRDCYHLNGKELVVVATIKDLEKINAQKHMLVLANIGTKKKYELVKVALDKKFEILNVEDAPKFVSAVEGLMKNRKEAREQVIARRKAKNEKKKEKKKEKKSVEEKVAETQGTEGSAVPKEKSLSKPAEKSTKKSIEKPEDVKAKKEKAKKEKDKVLTSAKEQY